MSIVSIMEGRWFGNARRQEPAREPLRAPFGHIRYRADIDGLRAIAVLTVLFFHAGLAPFSGGFVGVDIFFVISGYLITQIIAREVAEGSFSLSRFYERRVRRIFPALFTMLGLCAAVGWIILIPPDLAQFGSSVVSATAFLANIFYWQQSGYFEGPAELKILLHTWSLAVEEQFYLLFPFFLILSWRFFRERWWIAVAALTIVSFGLSLWAIERNPSAAFYLLPFRAWELLIGSILALGVVPPARKQWHRDLLSISGLCMILYAVFRFSDLTLFPGLNAGLPCVGAALILHSGEHGTSMVGRVLSTGPLVFVGLISYSLYLWHWPIFAFARYYVIAELSLAQAIALLSLSFLFGWASWAFVEKPFRRPGGANRGRVFKSAGLVMAGAALAGATAYGAQGWPSRFSSDITRLASSKESTSPIIDLCSGENEFVSSTCILGDRQGRKLFLWGDSHAGSLYGTFAALAAEGHSTVYAATPRCPPLLGIGTSEECIRANWEKLKYVRNSKDVDTVILAARWVVYFRGRAINAGPAETNHDLPLLRDSEGNGPPPMSEGQRILLEKGLRATVAELLRMKKRVVLVYPVPATGYDVPSTLARLASQDQDPASFSRPSALFFRRQAHVFKMLDALGQDPHLIRIYPHQRLCRMGRCQVYARGVPLYTDSHHLSLAGAELLTEPFHAALLQR